MAALLDVILLAASVALVHWLRWYGPWTAHVEQGIPDHGRTPDDLPFEFEATSIYASPGVPGRWMSSPWRLRVGVPAPPDVRIEIRRERFLHRVLDPLGLSHDATTGWRILDDALRVGIDQPAVLRALRETPGIQERVLALLRPGQQLTLRRLRCRGGALSVELRSENALPDARALAASVAEHLHAIAAALRAIPEANRGATSAATRRAIAVRALAAGLGVFAVIRSGLGTAIEGTVSAQPGVFAAGFGTVALAITGVLVIAALALTRGSTQRSAALFEILTFGLVGNLFAVGFFARDLNVALDRSAAQRIECTITEKRLPPEGYVLFGRNDCTDGRWLGSVRVTQATWEHARIGDRLRVNRHDGAFGYSYYRDPELLAQPE